MHGETIDTEDQFNLSGDKGVWGKALIETGKKATGWHWKIRTRRPLPTKPKLVPWTFETAPLTLKAKRKSDGKIYRAETHPTDVWIGVGKNCTYSDLLSDFTQLDGSPCGEESK